MMRMQVAALVLTGAAVTAVTAATGAAMQTMHEQVKVSAAGGEVLVTMTFDNRGDKPAQVPKAVAEDGELFGNHFQVTEAASGKEVTYIGPMVKRSPFGPEDYLTVKPHSKHSATLDITRAYEFLPGQHSYTLRYAGYHNADPRQAAAAGKPVQSAPVTFSYNKK